MATSIARPRAPRLWFANYPDPGVPPWLAARISWDSDGHGAGLEFRPDLSPRDQLRAICWAATVLPGYLWPDGNGFAAHRGGCGPVLRTVDLHRYGRTVHLLPCRFCGTDFDPDTSPHVDRCAGCDGLGVEAA